MSYENSMRGYYVEHLIHNLKKKSNSFMFAPKCHLCWFWDRSALWRRN